MNFMSTILWFLIMSLLVLQVYGRPVMNCMSNIRWQLIMDPMILLVRDQLVVRQHARRPSRARRRLHRKQRLKFVLPEGST